MSLRQTKERKKEKKKKKKDRTKERKKERKKEKKKERKRERKKERKKEIVTKHKIQKTFYRHTTPKGFKFYAFLCNRWFNLNLRLSTTHTLNVFLHRQTAAKVDVFRY
jgi:hypothetical protein